MKNAFICFWNHRPIWCAPLLFALVIGLAGFASTALAQHQAGPGEPCNIDKECPPLFACKLGVCTPAPELAPQCSRDRDCQGRLSLCRNQRCVDVECMQNTDCGRRQVCTDNTCRTVQCTDRDATGCQPDQRCDTSRNRCTDLCTAGQVWVQGQAGIKRCTACVNPRDPNVKSCAKGCSLDEVCATSTDGQSYCIESCGPKRLVPQKPGLLEDPNRLQLDQPPGGSLDKPDVRNDPNRLQQGQPTGSPLQSAPGTAPGQRTLGK